MLKRLGADEEDKTYCCNVQDISIKLLASFLIYVPVRGHTHAQPDATAAPQNLFPCGNQPKKIEE
jgi:hypothetical protein